jgi:flagellum-specific ATP synthase
MATYAGAEDLISVGAYAAGSNAEIDAAIARRADIESFLVQAISEKTAMADTLRRAGAIAGVEIPEAELAEPADAAPSARGSARGMDAAVPVPA